MMRREPGNVSSKIDLTGAFHRMPLIDSWVHFEFDRKMYKVKMGFFGVNILPSHFQRMIDAVAKECSFTCRIYLDDAFNEGGTPEEDILQCVELINLYTKYNLIVNSKKCYFGRKDLPALGFIVGRSGKRMNPSKIKAIMNWAKPQNGQEMCRLLGTLNFNRSHLPEYAMASAEMDKHRKAKTIVWNEALDKSFEACKALVKRDMVLVTRNRNLKLVLAVDGSSLGLGYILGQVKAEYKDLTSDQIRPEHVEILEYGSVALSNALVHGSATKRELAAVIFAFKKCYSYLAAEEFILFTDHAALTWLFTKLHTSPMLHRWIDMIMTLKFTVIHWKGEWNYLADALSRPSATGNMKTSDIPLKDRSAGSVVAIEEQNRNFEKLSLKQHDSSTSSQKSLHTLNNFACRQPTGCLCPK